MAQWTVFRDRNDRQPAVESALPRRRIVLADKEMCSHATQGGLADRLGTIMLTDLASLGENL